MQEHDSISDMWTCLPDYRDKKTYLLYLGTLFELKISYTPRTAEPPTDNYQRNISP